MTAYWCSGGDCNGKWGDYGVQKGIRGEWVTRGDRGTLWPGKDWRMWGFGPGTKQLVSWDWVGGLKGTGRRWAGLPFSSSLSLPLTHTHTHPGTLPGYSVPVMPLNSRLHHTQSKQPWSLSNHQHHLPRRSPQIQECDKDNIKLRAIMS